MEQQTRERPADKKEIRGITIELILKYVGMLFVVAYAYADMKNGQKATAEKISDQTKQIEALKTDIQALKTAKEANEIWKARFEERTKHTP